MDSYLSPALPNQPEIEAHPATKPTRVAISIVAAVTVCLLGFLLLCALPYSLPFLKPLAAHVLYRLREVSVFFLFTTVIAIGIFNSPWKAVDRQKHSPDQYPFSSIFGESGGSAMIKYALEGAEQKQGTRSDDNSISRGNLYNAMDLGSKINAECESDASSSRIAEDFSVPPLQRKASEADKLSSRETGTMVASTEKTTPTHRRNLSASREESCRPVDEGDQRPPTPLIAQGKLHRRSSSLDDSVNYEPSPEAEDARSQPNTQVFLPSSVSASQMPSSGSHNKVKPDVGRAKSIGMQKRVSFSMDRDTPSENQPQEGEQKTPLSSLSVSKGSRTGSPSNNVLPSSNIGENTSGSGEKRIPLSPNELDEKADAFIANFKEQIRMQQLESFQRYRRRPA